MSKTFSAADVAKNNKPDSLYIIVDEDVYDVTQFQDEHPGMVHLALTLTAALTFSIGGKKILTRVGGKDASKQFWKYHNESILKKFQPKLKIGSLDSKKQAAPAPAPAKKSAPAAAGEAGKKGTPVKPVAEAGTVSAAPTEDFDPPLDMFGDLVPYADPNWYQSVSCSS